MKKLLEKLMASPKLRLAGRTIFVTLAAGIGTALAANTRDGWVGLIIGALYAGVNVLTPLNTSVGKFSQ